MGVFGGICPGLWIACACAPLWAALWGFSGCDSMGVPPAALRGSVAAVGGSVGLPVPLRPVAAWLCPSVACGGLHPGRLCPSVRRCGLWLSRRGCGGVPRAAVPCGGSVHRPGGAAVGYPMPGQRKARASCTSSTRAQKNRRRDCTRGGSVVSFIHFQQFGQDSKRNN